jgi:endonuclease YncB( thermonuclease family)
MKTQKTLLSLAALAALFVTGCQPKTSSAASSSAVISSVSSNTPVSSSVIQDEDVVGETHINLSDDLFQTVTAVKSGRNYEEAKADFNRDGIERMLTTSDYTPNTAKDVFINYVDGDTTHFTTYNGLYTVKVRYLGVDTPESTSEIEVWGKSASKFNKSKLSAAKHIIVQSAGCAKTGEKAVADIDGYQRSLAYVWYTDVATPTKNDFRNLNLELVYEGYSLFSGSRSDMEESFYDAFTKANDIARTYKKHMFSDDVDPNYYYGAPKALGLDKLYDTAYYTNKSDTGIAYSLYCDEYTHWTFEGVVSAKIGNAFYLQDTIDGKAYGLYVFTLRSYAPVKVGNRLKVTGVLSFYGGAYELSGVAYSFFDHQVGDIEYVNDANGKHITETITPAAATQADIAAGKYPCVLVKLTPEAGKTDNYVYFNTSLSSYNGDVTSYSYGGSEETNSYNKTYPFYNTDNSMVLYGRFGTPMENEDTFSNLTNPSKGYVRIKLNQGINVSDPTTKEVISSYKYFTGTKDINGNDGYHYYVPKNPSLALALSEGTTSYDSLDADTKATVFRTQYTKKKVKDVVGVAQDYVSTGGNEMYSINIVSPTGDFDNFEENA